jgi:hypothetical protein
MIRVVIASVASAVALFSFVPAVSAQPAQPKVVPAAEKEKYGVYPIAYRELVTRWLETQLLDPASAQIEFLTEPKPVEVKGRDGEMFYGYSVEFTVNSRNKFGMYTGKQARRAYIRNGEVGSGGRITR